MPQIPTASPFEDTPQLRQQVIEAGLCLRDKLGYFISSWGNISVRLKEGFLVTPSRVEYHLITPDDFVVLSYDGERIAGTRVPSSECELHRRLLLRRPDVGVWIHHHGEWSSVLAGTRRCLPVVADDMAELIGGEVACARHVSAGRHRELADAAVEVIGDDAWALLLANHGAVCGGRTIPEALACCTILEKSVKMYVLGSLLGGVTPIDDLAWREERDRYLFRYGKPEDLKGVVK